MEPNIPKPSIFSVEQEEWTETLNLLLQAAVQKTLWVTLQSTVLILRARPYQLQFDGQTISLLGPQESRGDRIECAVDLPAHQIGSYYKIDHEPTGETCLWVSYRIYREGDQIDDRRTFAFLAIATSEEALDLAGSEALLPTVVQ